MAVIVLVIAATVALSLLLRQQPPAGAISRCSVATALAA